MMMRYARDGNEATNEKGTIGSLYIDNRGHADSYVGKENKWSSKQGSTSRENI
jgi:hypothetical protein